MNEKFAVELKGLTKKYGNFCAADNMSLALEENKIYGLLGRNGAGKTTMLNILSGRMFASGGEALVFGERAYENISALKKICFIEEKGFYANPVRVSLILDLASGLYPNWDREYAAKLVEMFELDTRKKYKQLSRGMESALGLIIGLASRAELTIFDEPSLGLDAIMRERFYETLIEDFAENPRTVILSTHMIDEISRIFEDIIIVDKGKILMYTNCDELRKHTFFISGKATDVATAAKEADAIILEEESFAGTLTAAVFAKMTPKAVEVQPMSLQKFFTLVNQPMIQAKLRERGVVI